MNLTVREVLALTTGDVVRLPDVRTNDPMMLNVGSKPKFLCKPGVVGKKLAVQIIKKLEEIEEDEFEELTTEGEE
jgi:flagellar motor switch protein FliM